MGFDLCFPCFSVPVIGMLALRVVQAVTFFCVILELFLFFFKDFIYVYKHLISMYSSTTEGVSDPMVDGCEPPRGARNWTHDIRMSRQYS